METITITKETVLNLATFTGEQNSAITALDAATSQHIGSAVSIGRWVDGASVASVIDNAVRFAADGRVMRPDEDGGRTARGTLAYLATPEALADVLWPEGATEPPTYPDVDGWARRVTAGAKVLPSLYVALTGIEAKTHPAAKATGTKAEQAGDKAAWIASVRTLVRNRAIAATEPAKPATKVNAKV